MMLLLLSAHAQERRSIIVDRDTDRPVPYATIKVLHTRLGQVASASGEFTLPIGLTDSVLISSVGYRDTILAGKDIKDRIALVPQPVPACSCSESRCLHSRRTTLKEK